VRNYLALLGWAPDDGREVMDLDETIAAFSLEGVTHASAAFDHQKLDWMNGEWIRRLPLPELEARALPLAQVRFGERLDLARFREALRIGQERAVTIVSLLEQMDFLFVDDDELVIKQDAWARLEATDRVEELLDVVDRHLAECDWTVAGVDLREALAAAGFEKLRKVMPALYVAVEGRPAGLPLFDSLVLLGRESSRARVRSARARLG
jgi:glutamyl-tRNA synthetase